MTTYNAFSDRQAWADLNLMDYGDYADCVEYVNQTWYGNDQLEGEWYYIDYDRRMIYAGSFGNYNSPGADSYTHCVVYGEYDEDREDFEADVQELEGSPEYLETEEESEEVK